MFETNNDSQAARVGDSYAEKGRHEIAKKYYDLAKYLRGGDGGGGGGVGENTFRIKSIEDVWYENYIEHDMIPF
jgi:hypothetical protein